MGSEPREEARAGGKGQAGQLSWRAAAAGFLVFLLLGGVTTATLRNNPLFSEPVAQPIAFSHRKHVEENELACSTCHASYEKEAFSGLPGRDVCEVCHAEAQGTSEEERKLVAILESGGPLEWKPLFRQPAHVFYSHRRHVVGVGIQCNVCHGAIGETVKPPGRVKPLSMDDCIACHQRTGASTACTSCHR